jgi:hypothetical protein
MSGEKNIAGVRIGRLVAIRPLHGGGPGVIWDIQCDCGNHIQLSTKAYMSGNNKSCGCLLKEVARSKCKAAHDAEFVGGTAIGCIKSTKLRSTSTSGYTGVSWNTNAHKYTAQITFRRKKYHLGCFDDPKDAYKAYLEAKDKLHGEFLRSIGK